MKSRSKMVYGLLLVTWCLVVAWQCEEHGRVVKTAKADLRNRSREISSTLSAVIRAMRFRGGIVQDRLEPVLVELVNQHTNAFNNSRGPLAIILLNTSDVPLVATGETNLMAGDSLGEGERWTPDTVTFVNPMVGASLGEEGETNKVILFPGFRELTNSLPPADRDLMRRGPRPDDGRPPGPPGFFPTNQPETNANGEILPPPPPPDDGHPHDGDRGGEHRPPWMRWMSASAYREVIAHGELHALVLVMSTESVSLARDHDWILRSIIILFAGLSVGGLGLAWRNISKNSVLQIRLVRASELNSHLKEMNLAAAGLAHETRNPLNIIRGLAQMISRQAGVPDDVREKTRVILDETDKVTAQLTEFINYSRPRELRRARVALPSAVAEVLRTLGGDIEENKISAATKGDNLAVEADDQMLRQVLFNLLLNAIQAVGNGGAIQIHFYRSLTNEVTLEIRDDGPGVPPERRQEIFKPYFTTHQKGTGLGLAVVQQIVLAHGWEIECLANEPKGAIFRISHLKLMP
jgi:signal transduction histidine kinase